MTTAIAKSDWECFPVDNKGDDASATSCASNCLSWTAATVRMPTDISALLKRLDDIFPIKSRYAHVKRIRQTKEAASTSAAAKPIIDVLLAPVDVIDVSSDRFVAVSDVLDDIRQVQVPSFASADPEVFAVQNSVWPLIKPPALLHSTHIAQGIQLPATDRSYVSQVLDVISQRADSVHTCAILYRSGDFGIVRALASHKQPHSGPHDSRPTSHMDGVETVNDSLDDHVCEVYESPLHSCVLRAIQQVADADVMRANISAVSGEKRSHATAFADASPRLTSCSCGDTANKAVAGVHSELLIMSVGVPNDKVEHTSYLCTNHDAFLSHEPNLLEAMALLHSRVQRVFFCIRDPADGVLVSQLHLPTLAGLNHRFQVFECKRKQVVIEEGPK